MNYRYDASYPFMDVARRHDADYGEVLRYAEAVRGRGVVEGADFRTITAAVGDEVYALTRQPVAERGGRTDTCDECGASARSGAEMHCQWSALDLPEKCMSPPDHEDVDYDL